MHLALCGFGPLCKTLALDLCVHGLGARLGTDARPLGALMGLVAAVLHWGARGANEGASPAMGQGLPMPRRGEFTGGVRGDGAGNG